MHLHWRQNTFGHVRSLITMSQSSWFVWRGWASASEPATPYTMNTFGAILRLTLAGLVAAVNRCGL